MQPSDGSSRSRRSLLINGRRVRILDLFRGGLLEPGQELFLERPRIGELHRAVVTSGGRIKLDDGQEFTSPSGAAAAVCGSAIDGWNAWRVGERGPFLFTLRQQLLKSVVDDAEPPEAVPHDIDDLVAARRRLDELTAARERAEAGAPEELTVRDLIKRWGVYERDREVTEQIEADLANHGLMTVPDFRAVSLDTMVRLAVLPGPDEAGGSPETEQPEAPDALHFATRAPNAELVEEETRDVGRTLGNVLADDHRLVFVEPSVTIQEAVTSMLLYDFSQLPVLAGQRQLRGAVTWKSIAQARQRDASANLSEAIVPARDFSYGTRLLDVLDVLLKEEFVFVRAHDNRLYGIVTAADVVRVYDDLATPFFLIGEVDQELRRLIRNTFDLGDVQRVRASGTSLQSFDDMTMGDYLAVLRNRECWEKLGWDLDRRVFGEHLDEIRKIRNTITHFNPDPISPAAVDRLRNFLSVVRAFDR